MLWLKPAAGFSINATDMRMQNILAQSQQDNKKSKRRCKGNVGTFEKTVAKFPTSPME